MGRPLETALYLPVKRFLENLGFTVKGEVGGCDVVALKGEDPPVVVICELKQVFNLEVLLQAVDRAGACDEVWVAAKLSARGKDGKAIRATAICAAGLVSACLRSPPPVRSKCWCSRPRLRHARTPKSGRVS